RRCRPGSSTTDGRVAGSSPATATSSIARGAAIDVDRLAGDEAAIVTHQKQAGGGDLVHLPLAAQGNTGGARHTPLIPFGIGSAGIDAAGADHIDPDVLRGEFGGQA